MLSKMCLPPSNGSVVVILDEFGRAERHADHASSACAATQASGASLTSQDLAEQGGYACAHYKLVALQQHSHTSCCVHRWTFPHLWNLAPTATVGSCLAFVKTFFVKKTTLNASKNASKLLLRAKQSGIVWVTILVRV